MAEGHVLVIGSAGIDVKALAPSPLHWDTTNLGEVRSSVGGVARNIAENLARLEIETYSPDRRRQGSVRQARHPLLEGSRRQLRARARRSKTGAPAARVTIFKEDGEPLLTISDYKIMHSVDCELSLEARAAFRPRHHDRHRRDA